MYGCYIHDHLHDHLYLTVMQRMFTPLNNNKSIKWEGFYGSELLSSIEMFWQVSQYSIENTALCTCIAFYSRLYSLNEWRQNSHIISMNTSCVLLMFSAYWSAPDKAISTQCFWNDIKRGWLYIPSQFGKKNSFQSIWFGLKYNIYPT